MQDRLNWEIQDLPLTLKYEWKIARNTSSFKHNLLVQLVYGGFSGQGEVAPNVRYGESAETLKEQFIGILPLLKQQKNTSPHEFAHLISELPIANALKNGIETAFMHYYCVAHKTSIQKILTIPIPDSPVLSSYTLPIMPVEELGKFIETHSLHRFKSLKVKVSKDTAMGLVNETLIHYKGPIRIDGNETWDEAGEVMRFLNQLPLQRIEFIEQPLKEQSVKEYIALKSMAPVPVLLDESVTHDPDFKTLVPQCHGINMKMMKAGGYHNSLRILQQAREHGLETMIGCMIETTLGIFSAINLSNRINYLDLDGFFVIENDPFTLVKEENGELIVNKELF